MARALPTVAAADAAVGSSLIWRRSLRRGRRAPAAVANGAHRQQRVVPRGPAEDGARWDGDSTTESQDELPSETSRLFAAAGVAASNKVNVEDIKDDDARATLPVVCVLGASGRTGAEVVRYCVSVGRPVRACTRSGSFDAATLLGDDALAAATIPWSSPLAGLGAAALGLNARVDKHSQHQLGTPGSPPGWFEKHRDLIRLVIIYLKNPSRRAPYVRKMLRRYVPLS